MLRKISIDGFKSINSLKLEFNNFTLLAGINSAGKSSVIQATVSSLLAESKGRCTDHEYAEIGKFSDVRNSIKGNKQICFELESIYKSIVDSNERYVFTQVSLDSDNTVVEREPEEIKNLRCCHAVYLSVERVGVEKLYELNTANSKEIGKYGEYVYSYLAMFGQEVIPEIKFAYQPEEYGMVLKNQVNYWLGYLLGFQIRAEQVPDADMVIVTYSNAGNNKYYRAKNVGTGVTYISMLVIAALTCKAGDILIIENPEIHLHPRAQSRFMQFLAFLAKRGLQVVVETHSDHIYNGLRKCVKRKELDKGQVSVYYFELDDTMQTKVTRIELNEQGAEKNHPYGMFDQFDDDLDELLDL